MNIPMDCTNNSYLLVNTRILRENVLSVRNTLAPGVQIIPVLKADGYGLGMGRCARAVQGIDAVKMFGVAHASEALELRRLGIEKDILLLGHPVPMFIPSLLENRITFTVGRPGLLSELASAAAEKVKFQCKIDTGLHRIGFEPGAALDAFIREYKACADKVELTGVFSHFADGSDREGCAAQFTRFQEALAQLESAGISVPLRHISASASSELFPGYDLDAVRLGRRLMFDHPDQPNGTVRECASWRTWVTAVFPRRAGEVIGYFSDRQLSRDSLLAVLAVGYGDGLPPELIKKGSVLIRGRRCPFVTISMDVCLADVTGLDVSVGDEATLFGYDRSGNFLSAQEQANTFGHNEGCGITSALSPRVQRIYTEE